MRTIKSISKALFVLELFSTKNEEMALGDISKLLKMDKATVSHIVSTLVMHGFLKQSTKRGKYSLGVRALNLGCNPDENTRNRFWSMDHVTELSETMNESVHLTFWNGTNVTYREPFDYITGAVKVTPVDWAIFPLHGTAAGKLILADMDEEGFNKYICMKPLEKYTPYTIVDINRLKDNLSIIRRDGIAFEVEENNPGMNGLAAPIKNSKREFIGAIFIVGPSSRLTRDLMEKTAISVKICALKISQSLGYNIRLL
jgi:IclR family transcriptional regulator, KDG regulon repressor